MIYLFCLHSRPDAADLADSQNTVCSCLFVCVWMFWCLRKSTSVNISVCVYLCISTLMVLLRLTHHCLGFQQLGFCLMQDIMVLYDVKLLFHLLIQFLSFFCVFMHAHVDTMRQKRRDKCKTLSKKCYFCQAGANKRECEMCIMIG